MSNSVSKLSLVIDCIFIIDGELWTIVINGFKRSILNPYSLPAYAGRVYETWKKPGLQVLSYAESRIFEDSY